MPTASNQSRPDDLSALNERLENIENTLRLILLHLVMDEAGRSMSDLNDPTGDTTVVKNEKVRPVAVREKHASRTKAKVSSSVKSRRRVATSSSTGRTSGGKTSKEKTKVSAAVKSRRKTVTSSSTGRTSGGKTSKEKTKASAAVKSRRKTLWSIGGML